MVGAAVISMGMMSVSCEDQPDKFKLTDGVPTIHYIRPASVQGRDSLIVAGYLDNNICIVGDNLTSIKELFFNDQKAILNTSYMTDHTIVVTIPGGIPEVVTNKMYMITSGNDTVSYDFSVRVPAPSVRSISCEWAAPGKIATIYGDYFIDDPNIPIKISFAGNVDVPYENITKISKTSLSFVIPDNWTEGYMNVTSLYGTGRSAYKFHDTTNILFDWDGSEGGLATGHGWRSGMIHSPGQDDGVEAVDGNYLYFAGDLLGAAGGSWAEDQFSFNYWPDESGEFGPLCDRPEFAELIASKGVENLQMKFEMYIPSSNPWQSCAMQLIFSSNENVTYATANNQYFGNTAVPRGLYIPWKSTGSYDTGDEWVTVSVPLSNFSYTHEGGSCSNGLTPERMTGFTMFVWNGGVEGADCSPVILLDNIRVVPIEL